MKERGSLFERLKTGLEAGIQFARGKLTLKTVDRVAPPPTIGPQEIIRLRQSGGLSQSVLAETLGVSVKTLQSWEQGARKPSPLACRLLQIVAADPDTVYRIVGVKAKNGMTPTKVKKQKARAISR
jgi:putative transcriptional regulator